MTSTMPRVTLSHLALFDASQTKKDPLDSFVQGIYWHTPPLDGADLFAEKIYDDIIAAVNKAENRHTPKTSVLDNYFLLHHFGLVSEDAFMILRALDCKDASVAYHNGQFILYKERNVPAMPDSKASDLEIFMPDAAPKDPFVQQAAHAAASFDCQRVPMSFTEAVKILKTARDAPVGVGEWPSGVAKRCAYPQDSFQELINLRSSIKTHKPKTNVETTCNYSRLPKKPRDIGVWKIIKKATNG